MDAHRANAPRRLVEKELYGASSIETRHLAKNFNFLFISKIYSTISVQCSSVISSIFQKIARCRVSIDEAPYGKSMNVV